MYSHVLLVIGLLNAGLSSPLYNPALSGESKPEEAQATLQVNRNPLDLNNGVTERSTNYDVQAKTSDLMGQETFYPTGGVWWGVRPWPGWGGWGGYRPWYGWHGWHGWHRPHWGGNWGGHWGGGHGGRPWGGSWGGGRST